MLKQCPHCHATVVPKEDRTCPNCQGHLEGAPATQRKPDGMVARKCPNCGSSEHTLVKPDRWVTYTFDRLCTPCGTRYVMPTPVWAAIVFVLIGLLLGGVSTLEAVSHLVQGEIVLVLWKGMFALLGGASLIHGIRCGLAGRRD